MGISEDRFVSVELATISAGNVLSFDLYQRTGGVFRLFRRRTVALKQDDLDGLVDAGTTHLYVLRSQEAALLTYRAESLPRLLSDPSLPAKRKMSLLTDVSIDLMDRLLSEPESTEAVRGATVQAENHVDLACQGAEAQQSLLEGRPPKAPYAVAHAIQVCNLSILLGLRLGIESADELIAVGTAALLHEVGKRIIDPKYYSRSSRGIYISSKRLTKYPEVGVNMLREQGAVSAEALRTIREHQERIDGSGFPNQLKGPQVCRAARIVAVCDSYDEALHREQKLAGPSAFQVLMVMKRQSQRFDQDVFIEFVRLLGSDLVSAPHCVPN